MYVVLGETPLHLACIHNDAMKVDEILKQKDLDVNMTDHAGWTALHEACNRGYVQCVKKILQYHGRFCDVYIFVVVLVYWWA